jgi:hypothetical protein
MQSPFIRRGVILLGLVVCGCVLLAGCFETTLNLGSAADAKVDPAYCGDWHFEWKDGDTTASADLLLRNFDGKQYYAEWNDKKSETLRMSGFLIPIKDATFAQVTAMEADGHLEAKHMILRVKLDGADKLVLTNLKDDFFKDVSTDAGLRKKVEENLDNPAMYEDVGTGTRVASAAPQ